MSNIKPAILDRIEYAGIFFKQHWLQIILPTFLFLFVTQILIGSVLGFLFVSFIDVESLVDNPDGLLLSLFTDPSFITLIAVSIFLLLVYLLLVIPFAMASLRAIRNGLNNKLNTLSDNISYGFKIFFKALNLYWYLFAYTALLPCLFLIVGGVLVLAGQLYEPALLKAGLVVASLALGFLLIFLIYRGIKASFSMYNAIDKEDFSKQEFGYSVKITDGNWWRILGNFMAMGLIISLIGSMVHPFIDTLFFILGGGSSQDFVSLAFASDEEISTQQLSDLLSSMKEFSFVSVLHKVVSLSITTVVNSFIVLFGYIFYKSLTKEYTVKDPQVNGTL